MNKINVKSNVLSNRNDHINHNKISIHNNNNNNNNNIDNKTTMKTATKMYLSIILSMVCIMFYQYQLSKANFITWQGGSNENRNNGVVTTNRNSIEANEVLLKVNLLPLNKSQSVAPLNVSDKSEEPQLSVDGNSLEFFQMFNSNKNANSSNTLESFDVNLKIASSDDGNPTNSVWRMEEVLNQSMRSAPLPPALYIITPTYRRPEQLAEITRLGNTLKHIPNLFWLVVEDATVPTALVTRQLHRLGIPFAHLVAPMPNKYKRRMVKPRGVSNRNRGLAWIRKNATEGVFYFADDDNTYDLEIFHQMRHTKKVSMWPVGLVTKFGLSSPIVKDGKMVGFYDGWIGGRRFPVDMAGFAVNIKFFLSRPKAIMPYDAGYEEDKFLKSLAPLNVTEIELLASNCTEILTWHTQTKKNAPATPLDMKKYNGTNLVTLRKTIV